VIVNPDQIHKLTQETEADYVRPPAVRQPPKGAKGKAKKGRKSNAEKEAIKIDEDEEKEAEVRGVGLGVEDGSVVSMRRVTCGV
jgi:hypothetical protein